MVNYRNNDTSERNARKKPLGEMKGNKNNPHNKHRKQRKYKEGIK